MTREELEKAATWCEEKDGENSLLEFSALRFAAAQMRKAATQPPPPVVEGGVRCPEEIGKTARRIVAMAWTSEIPAESGYYWWRAAETGAFASIVSVVKRQELTVMYYTLSKLAIDCNGSGGEWYGPLVEPDPKKHVGSTPEGQG